MAYIPSKQALGRMNQARNQRIEELGKVLNSVGGSNPALTTNYARNNPLPTASIPVLEQAVIDTYNNGNRNTRQQIAPTYEDIRNTQVQRALDKLGQTDLLRGTNSEIVESIKNAGEGRNGLERYINTPYSAGNYVKNVVNGLTQMFSDRVNALPGIENIYGGATFGKEVGDFARRNGQPTITPELEALGFTEQDLRRWRDAQNETERQEVLSQFAKDNPAIATVNSVPENLVGSIYNLERQIQDYVTNQPLRERQTNADIMRNAVNEEIDSDAGKFAYNTANSILDAATSILASGGAAPVGMGLMGSQAANSYMNNAINRGLTPNQVMAEGGLSFLATALTEMIPFESIVNGSSIWRSIFSEGLQEASEDVVNTAFDQLITGLGGNHDRSELRQDYNAYITAGYDKNEALKAVASDYVKQLAMDAIGGAISGGVLGAGSNIVQGRNPITGRIPTLNTETETNTEENTAEPTIPIVRDSIGEEANIQNQRADEMAQLSEAYAQIEQTRRAEEARQEEIRRAEQAERDRIASEERERNYDPETMNYLRSTLRSLFNDNWNTPTQAEQTIPSVNSQTIEETTQPIPSVEIQAEPTVVGLTNREVNNYRQQAENIVSNLKSYPKTQSMQTKVNKAFDKIYNSKGEAQIKAVEDFNNVVNQINEKMSGETVGIAARDVNKDLYEDMKRVTDGRRIRVSKDAIRQLGLSKDTFTELNNATNTRSANRIKFVEKGGTPIDSAYMEMYDLAHGTLPDPTNMAEGDLLKALYNYITEPKSASNEMAYEQVWEQLPVLNEDIMSNVQKLVDDMYNRVQNGTANGVDIYDLYSRLYEIAQRNPELAQEIDSVFSKVTDAYYNQGLDEEVANIKTEEEAVKALDKEVNNFMNIELEFFGNGSEDAEENFDTNEEEREVHTGKFKKSKLAIKTVPNSGIVTDEEFKKNISDKDKSYEAVTHESTFNKAEELIKKNGFKGETDRVLNSTIDDKWDAVDTDAAMMCFKKAVNDARNAEALGVDPKEAWKKTGKIFLKIREHATVAGQAIEALKKWSMNTPEGKLAQAIAFANEAESYTGETNQLKELKKAGKAYEIEFSEDFIQKFLEKAHQYEGKNVSKAKEARLNAELAHMVKEQVPPKFRDKFRAFWMDNLLASFRTLFSRNVGGNAGKAALDQTLVKAFSGPLDKFLSKYTGERTTTGFTREGFKRGWEGFKKGASTTIKDYWMPNADPDATLKELSKDLKENLDLLGDAKVTNRQGVDEDSFREALKNNGSPFSNKALRFYDKCIKFGLTFSDNPFYSQVYEQTLYELNELKNNPKYANLKDGQNFKDIPDDRFEQWAKAYATANALEAVYQDNTKLSEGAMQIKNGLGQMAEGYIGFDFLSGASMPFVRTPMNVIKSNLELSPLGIIKNSIQTIKEINENLKNGRSALDTTSFNQGRFVRETSRNAVGTLMFMIGLGLKNLGLLTGGYSENDKEKQAQKEAGMQEYAFVNPINGNQYSINWIPGLGSNLVSASAFDDAYKKPDQNTLEAIANGLKEGSSSMFEMAALQGLQRLTGTANYNSDNSIIDNAVQTVANTASSAIVPSFVRQTAQAMDPYRRNTYGTGGYESIVNNAIAGIPGLRQTLEPRIGSNGEPLAQNAGRNTVEKWFDNLVNPAMVTVPSALSDPVREEATRLFNATRNYTAFQPTNDKSYLKYEDHEPTTEELTEFWRVSNSAMNQIAGNVIQSDYYQGLDDLDKEKMLKNVYDAVRQAERVNILGLDDSSLKGAAKAYYEGGEEGLIDYLTIGSALNQMGLSNNASYRPTIQEKIDEGGAEAVQQMVNDSLTLTDLGASENMIFKYDHASQYIPTLNPQSFYDTYNAIDTSNNESITQAELIDYINSGKYDEQTAMQLWQAYGDNWVKIPVLNESTGLYEVKKV